jgi:hypothetical protein
MNCVLGMGFSLLCSSLALFSGLFWRISTMHPTIKKALQNTTVLKEAVCLYAVDEPSFPNPNACCEISMKKMPKS